MLDRSLRWRGGGDCAQRLWTCRVGGAFYSHAARYGHIRRSVALRDRTRDNNLYRVMLRRLFEMPINLKEFAEPVITAMVIHEMQEGVVGKSVPGPLRQLADVVEQRSVVSHLSRLLKAARKAGVKVFHCPAFS